MMVRHYQIYHLAKLITKKTQQVGGGSVEEAILV